MPDGRSRFAGGDQEYLREVQYRDSNRLARRAGLHARYSTAEIPWFEWAASKAGLSAGMRVLEVGCGPGWLWEQSTASVPEGVALTLTDLSAGMLWEAIERVVATGRFASVTGGVVDAQSLPFVDSSFDRVIANHMLYHLSDPARGVAELARIVTGEGVVVVATNGQQHMRQLWAIRGDVFGMDPVDQTVDVFGAETGFPILRDQFDEVRWTAYRNDLRCTDPDDVVAYLCSTPPGEEAAPEHRAQLEHRILMAFEAGNGTMTISTDTGCFVCANPHDA